MDMDALLFVFYLLTVFNIWHIFEEIDAEIWLAMKKTRRTYLIVCCVISGFILTTGYLLAINNPVGNVLRYIVGAIACVQSIHIVAWVKKRETHGTLAGGLYTTLPLVICGILTLVF